jgi:3-phenylpropionate/trans-cinnamate dioxygenase ferredoxin reductase subunit
MAENAKYVLIGGGVASVSAAQAIRKRDEDGSLVIIAAETSLPYDRPPLSKQFLTGEDAAPEDVLTKPAEFYADSGIQVRTGSAATAIDRAKRVVTLADGEKIAYEKLLLATGATPRPLPVPGGDLPGVHYLRTVEDAQALRGALQSSNSCVLIGAGYIGTEVAAAAVTRGLKATVIERGPHPWPTFASPTLGNFLRKYYEGRGVEFVVEAEVAELTGDGRFAAARTADGASIGGDFAVVGVGVTLNVRLAADAGLDADAAGVKVNSCLQTSDPHIWVAGDVACFHDVVAGHQRHVEHFMHAKWLGTTAGTNMAGEEKEFSRVPYFFSEILDLHMCLRGEPGAGQSASTIGSVDDAEFVELYADDAGVLRMGVVISRDEDRANNVAGALNALVKDGALVADLDAEAVGF